MSKKLPPRIIEPNPASRAAQATSRARKRTAAEPVNQPNKQDPPETVAADDSVMVDFPDLGKITVEKMRQGIATSAAEYARGKDPYFAWKAYLLSRVLAQKTKQATFAPPPEVIGYFDKCADAMQWANSNDEILKAIGFVPKQGQAIGAAAFADKVERSHMFATFYYKHQSGDNLTDLFEELAKRTGKNWKAIKERYYQALRKFK